MVLDQSLVNKIDDPKVVFVSDRGEKINLFESTCICDDTTSCTRLLYKKFKPKFELPVDASVSSLRKSKKKFKMKRISMI